MKNFTDFCNLSDFTFICEWLSHNQINIEVCDDIDALYKIVKDSYVSFELSPYFTQNTSLLQACKDFLNSEWNA